MREERPNGVPRCRDMQITLRSELPAGNPELELLGSVFVRFEDVQRGEPRRREGSETFLERNWVLRRFPEVS